VVAVLALGAGSYWFMGRESEGTKSATLSEGPAVRKERAVTEDTRSKRKKETRTATREEPTIVERKEREAPDENTVERKKRREDRTKEKKKASAPAA